MHILSLHRLLSYKKKQMKRNLFSLLLTRRGDLFLSVFHIQQMDFVSVYLKQKLCSVPIESFFYIYIYFPEEEVLIKL